MQDQERDAMVRQVGVMKTNQPEPGTLTLTLALALALPLTLPNQ